MCIEGMIARGDGLLVDLVAIRWVLDLLSRIYGKYRTSSMFFLIRQRFDI